MPPHVVVPWAVMLAVVSLERYLRHPEKGDAGSGAPAGRTIQEAARN